MELQELLILMVFYVTLVTIPAQECPMSACDCQQYPGNIRVINCRDKGLTKIPTVDFPSTSYAYKVSFSTSQDTSSEYCYKCNDITSIHDNAFQGIIVIALDLSKNPLGHVSPGAFNGLEKNLTELFISGDKISKPPYLALSNLHKLETIELNQFYQSFMDETNNFGQFPNLKKLILKDMNMTYITSLSFRNRLQNLKQFHLIGNKELGTIPVGALRYLSSLTDLYLLRNGIKTVPYGAFNKLLELKKLDLSDNQISRLESGCFKNIQDSLETLNLHLNNLDEFKLQSLTTGYWTHLRELNLAHNQLRRIPENLFVNMIALKHVHLNSNKLVSIHKYDFKALGKLKEIDLTSNQLLYIEPDSFVDLQSLAFLDLRGQNEWNKDLKLNITREAVRGLEQVLEELLLQRTHLVESTIWDAIRVLKRLRVLQLGKTGLTFIKDYSFKEHSYLQYLDLSENSIFEFDSKDFFGLKDSLLTLDISQNSINVINECVFKDFTRLNQIYLWQNPLHCDCKFTWLYDWIKEKEKDDPFIIYTADPMCDTPVNLHRFPLYRVKRDDLKCDINYSRPVCHTTTLPPSTTKTIKRVTSTMNTPPIFVGTVKTPMVYVEIEYKDSTRIQLKWKLSENDNTEAFKLSILKDNGQSIPHDFLLERTISHFLFNRLDPNSFYEICLHVIMHGSRTSENECLYVKTYPVSHGSNNIYNMYCLAAVIVLNFILKLML